MARTPLLLSALLAAASSSALSQSNVSPPDGTTLNAMPQATADARVSVAPLRYRSSFKAFQGDKVEELLPWREVNDRVASIGGWRVYARETQAPTPEAPPTASPTGKQPSPVR